MDARRALLIGKRVRVIASKNISLTGISGVVEDETRNTLLIRTGKEIKKVPKKQCTFEFEIGEEKVTIRGDEIQKRPEERVGMKIK